MADDSSSFQFWGSEQARRGVTLMAPDSHFVKPVSLGLHASAQLRDWDREAAAAQRQAAGATRPRGSSSPSRPADAAPRSRTSSGRVRDHASGPGGRGSRGPGPPRRRECARHRRLRGVRRPRSRAARSGALAPPRTTRRYLLLADAVFGTMVALAVELAVYSFSTHFGDRVRAVLARRTARNVTGAAVAAPGLATGDGPAGLVVMERGCTGCAGPRGGQAGRVELRVDDAAGPPAPLRRLPLPPRPGDRPEPERQDRPALPGRASRSTTTGSTTPT